jgi:hypothetical protein
MNTGFLGIDRRIVFRPARDFAAFVISDYIPHCRTPGRTIQKRRIHQPPHTGSLGIANFLTAGPAFGARQKLTTSARIELPRQESAV